MSELAKTDPIFGGQDVHLSEERKRFRLEDVDPIFKIEDKDRNPEIKPASEQNFTEWLIQKVEQIPLDKAEVVGGGLAGYFVNPKLQKPLMLLRRCRQKPVVKNGLQIGQTKNALVLAVYPRHLPLTSDQKVKVRLPQK